MASFITSECFCKNKAKLRRGDCTSGSTSRSDINKHNHLTPMPTLFPNPPYSNDFYEPSPNQEVLASAAGEITVSGKLSGFRLRAGETEPAGLPNVSVTVTLTLGGQSFARTVRTDDEGPPGPAYHEGGGWETSFHVSQSGPATIQVDWSDAHGAVHDSVNFSVKITQRQPISVEL